ncbi:MAG: UvrD-helicase domain-containing protein [Clostridiales bacterium]|nr:UvrD-helicase domain-containing protein [Clostridiales bacterium]
MERTQFDIRYATLRRAVIERDFAHLNDKQKEAVFNTEGPVLILAGAGSGKTTVLINKIVNILRYGSGVQCEQAPFFAKDEELRRLARYLAEKPQTEEELTDMYRLCSVSPARPWEVIAITFTNKAANELRERLNTAIGAEAASGVWAHTFHSACLRILRSNFDKASLSRNFTIYDEDDKRRVLTESIRALGLDEKHYDPRAVGSEISRAKDNLLSPRAYEAENGNDHYRKTVASIYHEYQGRLSMSDAMDFDDIIVKTVELLKKHEEVRNHYQNQFRYVLVDEYQDTNYAQYVLSSLLAGGRRNISVVGDDDQSIYKFRGATIQNILGFEDQYPDALVIRLEQNYRSTSTILNAANGVIKNNCGRKSKTLWTENPAGGKITVYRGSTQEEETEFIASNILRDVSEGVPFSKHAVLYRNNVLSNNVEQAFKRNGIPYRILSGLRFFDRAEIKDMLANLWIIQNPADTLRLKRIINNPKRNIGDRSIEKAEQIAHNEKTTVFEILKNANEYPELSRGREQMTAFCKMIEELRQMEEFLPLDELYDELLEKSSYMSALKIKNDMESRARIENVLELKSNITDYCTRTEKPSLNGFLEEISLFTDIDRYDASADAVIMMTMHAAKGLEFDHVFLCGMEEGLFPSFRSMESDDDIEEERRLCYVAMTRAKKNLRITCADRRMIFGQTRYSRPSRFIEEIPQEFIEKFEPQTNITENKESGYRYKPTEPVTLPKISSFVTKKEEQPSANLYAVGEMITHKAFGRGMILAATPMGGDCLLEIAFDGVGTKRLMAKSASQYMKKA